ncbi:MAG TPA: YhjD/YihY/BrkB family envelope integrity protein [Acidimicrobiales bacterium]
MERLDRLRASVTANLERATTAAEAARERSVAVDTVFAARERDQRAVGGALAGAVAFRLFVYLLPVFLAVVTLLGVVASLGGDAGSAVGDDLGMSRYVIESVKTATEQSERGLWALIPLTLWATYTAGVGAAKVLRATHALAWGQPMTKLPRAWTAAVATFAVVTLTVLAAAGTQALRQRSEGLGLGFAVAQVVLFAGLWLVASHLLPHDPRAGWTALLPGAVLVGVGVWALHLASVFLLARRVAKASALYGSLGVAAAILAWLYLLGRLLVASAMLNATIWERGRDPDHGSGRRPDGEAVAPPPTGGPPPIPPTG